MTTQDYLTTYQTHKEIFENFFKENAKMYWKIWTQHNIDGISYDKLASLYNYSKSSIKNINDRVEHFLGNPTYQNDDNDFLSKILSGSINYPNEFVGIVNSLSLNAYKIWLETIYLYQNNMELEIPRNHILYFSSQYKNTDRRRALFEELRQLKIQLANKNEIQAFSKINDNKGNMEFKFTEECLDYIDPLRHLLKLLISTEDYKKNG